MITVKATREGLVGGHTASGYVIDAIVSFCALPTPHALGMHVRIINPINNKTCIAQVLDVGPWNIKDDAYVFQWRAESVETRKAHLALAEVRPQSESGLDMMKPPRKTNGAGIDLSESVWRTLDMKDNGLVSWEFIS